MFVCRSLDEPPQLPAFTKCTRQERQATTPIAGLTSDVAEMAKAISHQYSSGQSSETVQSTRNTSGSGISPAKLANLRSNYLQQMRDLHSLFESGAITEAEFLEQKAPILEQLKILKPN